MSLKGENFNKLAEVSRNHSLTANTKLWEENFYG